MPTVVCSCGSTFSTQTDWHRHYQSGKPTNARQRQDYARNHVPSNRHSEQIGTGAITTRLETHDKPINDRLKEISRLLEQAYAQVQMLEDEQHKLLVQLDPLPVKEPQWYKSDVRGTCKKCGRPTRWMHPHGFYCCYQEIHIEKIETHRNGGNIVTGRLSELLGSILDSD